MSNKLPTDHDYEPGEIFVFGSNLAGAHGAGAARDALERYGALLSVGRGPMGQSYALPTKDERVQTLPLHRVRKEVEDFLVYANANPEEKFFLTRVGCGLAGYTDADIAPMFKDAPSNVRKPPGW